MAALHDRVRKPAPVRAQVSAQEWAARVDLAAAYRLAAKERWQEPYSIFNHFAARVPGEPTFMLIKPHKLLFSEVTASSLAKVDMQGPPLTWSDNLNPAGFALHSAVLLARPDVNASIHIHGAAGTAICSLKRGLLFINQVSMRYYNRIGYHEFEGYAAMDEGERLVRDLGSHYALILRNHGLLTCGPSVGFAMMEMQLLLEAADAQLRTLATGEEIVQPAPELCAEVAGSPYSVEERPEAWEAIKRYLDRIDRSYRE